METSPYTREFPATERAAAAAIPTIQVPDKNTRLAVFAVLLQLACAIALGYLLQWRTGLDMAIGGGAAFLVLFYSFFAWGNRRAIRRFLHEIHRGDGPPTIARVEHACIAAGRLSPAWLASAVRERMPEIRVLHIREDKPDEGPPLTPPPPFDHGFGPTPLRQSDPLFRGLSGLPLGEDWNRAKEFWRTSGVGQEIKRTSRIALVIAALMIGAMLIVFLVNAVLDLLRGRLPSRIPSFIWIWAASLLFIGLVRMFQPSEWLLVPGGLLIRQGTWRSGQWKVTEFARESSTLICWKNTVAVASAESADARNVTSHELEALLRAWFSDAPRPPLENMGDLR